jgi:hypothetical protein
MGQRRDGVELRWYTAIDRPTRPGRRTNALRNFRHRPAKFRIPLPGGGEWLKTSAIFGDPRPFWLAQVLPL